MSKVTIALGSLIVGATLGFFCGNQTSTVAHAFFAQEPAHPNRPEFISAPAAEPRIPGIMSHSSGNTVEGATQQLDGMEFKNSSFIDVTFEYSGGAFILENDTFTTPMRVNLKGAAANTWGLIALVNAINSGGKPAPLNRDAPVVKTATHKHTVTIDVRSPFQGAP